MPAEHLAAESVPAEHRVRFWIRRYLPSEIAGTAAALIGAWVSFAITGSLVVAAICGTLAENVGFYGVAGARNFIDHRRTARRTATSRTRRSVIAAAWLTAVEFGPAEALDTLCVRPALLYLGPALLGVAGLGWIVGKFAADIIFYVVAGTCFLLSRRVLHRSATR